MSAAHDLIEVGKILRRANLKLRGPENKRMLKEILTMLGLLISSVQDVKPAKHSHD